MNTARITLEEIKTGIVEYPEFAQAFGLNAYVEDSGARICTYLGVDPDVVEYMAEEAPSPLHASGWLFGFTFALWLLNTKRNIVLGDTT